MKTYCHFTNDKLRNGEPIPPVGEWLAVEGELIPCSWGLHASEHPYDAMRYAPGFLLHKVELDGEIIPHYDDKVVARKRKIIATIDAAKLCRDFARKVALDVIHLWDAPEIVKKYLETGDESIRQEARDATINDDHDASWVAYRATAANTAYAAAYAASCAAAATTNMTYAAVYANANKYRRWFLEMVEKEFALKSKS